MPVSETCAPEAQAPLGACPFCHSGAGELFEIDGGVWAVCCLGCQAIGPHCSTPQSAAERWARSD